MPTKQVLLPIGIGDYYILEADSRRKELYVQNISTPGSVFISEGTYPKTALGATVTNTQLITLANQYDWFEANKSLGWETEGVWYLWASTTSVKVVINEGFGEPLATERAKPIMRPM